MIVLKVTCPVCGRTAKVRQPDNSGWSDTYRALLGIGWRPVLDTHNRQTLQFCSERCRRIGTD